MDFQLSSIVESLNSCYEINLFTLVFSETMRKVWVVWRKQPTSERSGEVADGQVGDVEINTGDATNTAVLTTTGNNNYSTFAPSGRTGSVFVGNSDNASGSTNTGSINLSSIS